ncbi:MAG: hypothetical protein HUU50_02480 [Candidatus Brocadiae bacterium]|nr:hypothetical protein [Candidatus Brocadiia bacterium]
MKVIMKSKPDGLVVIAKSDKGEDLRKYFLSTGRQQGKTELAKKLLGEIKKDGIKQDRKSQNS